MHLLCSFCCGKGRLPKLSPFAPRKQREMIATFAERKATEGFPQQKLCRSTISGRSPDRGGGTIAPLSFRAKTPAACLAPCLSPPVALFLCGQVVR